LENQILIVVTTKILFFKREQNFGSTRGLKTHTKDLDFASLNAFPKVVF